jgi:hypothetical protein
VVRPLLELRQPYLDREGLEAAIWRLTGARNSESVEQLLRAADAYAASQGPALAERLKERDRMRNRWQTGLDSYLFHRPQPGTALAEELPGSRIPRQELPNSSAAAIAAIASVVPMTIDDRDVNIVDPRTLPASFRPDKAAQVWMGDDGEMVQVCSKCTLPKPYSQFHNDAARWNGKASRCKICKNASNNSSKNRPGQSAGSLRMAG